MNTLSLEEYEKTRPSDEVKTKIKNFMIRSYVDGNGKLHILVHHINNEGNEELPLGYLNGSNALIFGGRK